MWPSIVFGCIDRLLSAMNIDRGKIDGCDILFKKIEY